VITARTIPKMLALASFSKTPKALQLFSLAI
jgi:hypothetical protein